MAVKSTKSGVRTASARGQPGLSIVVPLFNEAKGLAGLHERIAEVARFLKVKRGLALEVIYIDDGSSDNTWSIIESLTTTSAIFVGAKLVVVICKAGLIVMLKVLVTLAPAAS